MKSVVELELIKELVRDFLEQALVMEDHVFLKILMDLSLIKKKKKLSVDLQRLLRK